MQSLCRVSSPFQCTLSASRTTKKTLLMALVTTVASIALAYFARRLQASSRIKESEVVKIENLCELEKDFQSVAFKEQDLSVLVFENYLEPNEGNPEGILPCLNQVTTPGVFVSTGTERSFFDLILADPDKCKGLVIVDINPQVKAYNDCLIMLIRLSKDIDQFNQLSAKLSFKEGSEQMKDRVSLIRSLLEQSDIPNKLYYLKNLETLANFYFKAFLRDWRTDKAFEVVNYTKNKEQFLKLKKYIDQRSVISVVGDINDLEFLSKHSIAVIDTSNINNYYMINPRGIDHCAPVVIHTMQRCSSTRYFSLEYKNQVLTEEEGVEFDRRLQQLISEGNILRTGNLSSEIANCRSLTYTLNNEPYPGQILVGRNRVTLEFFREYEGKYWVHCPASRK